QLFQQEGIEALQHVELLAAVHRQIELVEDVLEDLLEGDVGVEDEDGLGLLVELIEQLVEQGRLARTRFTDERDEALALGDAVVERSEGLAIARVQIEELRIGSDV